MPIQLKPVTLNVAPTAATTNNICTTHTPITTAPLTIAGTAVTAGVATLGAAQLIRLTSAGDDSAITFTFTGTDADGDAQSQTVAGTNASNTDTTTFFKTITAITHTGTVAGAVIVGNLITSVSPTFFPANVPGSVALGINVQLVSGTTTCALNQTYEDFKTYPADTRWFAHATLTALSATTAGSLLFPVTGLRMRVSASSSAVIRTQIVQSGV